MAIMAIFLTVAVETVTFQARREKEEELIFRGNQIVEGVRLFRARNGRFPVTLQELWKAKPRVVRKAWTDPITAKADWVPVFLGQEGRRVGRPGPRAPSPTPTPTGGEGTGEGEFPATTATGPILGVHSRSCDATIKLLEGRSRYCDWKFAFGPQSPGQGPLQPPSGQPTPSR